MSANVSMLYTNDTSKTAEQNDLQLGVTNV